MREDNDGMDVITRTEFDEAMKHAITKEDLQAALGDTKAEIADVIKTQLARAWLGNQADFREELAKTKLEILSVNKKNIADAIAPLATKVEMQEIAKNVEKVAVDMADGFHELGEQLKAARS